MKNFKNWGVMILLILVATPSCEENLELTPKDKSAISPDNEQALSVENPKELFQHYDYVMVDNRTNEELCLLDFKGRIIFRSRPKRIDKGKFLVQEKGIFNLSTCEIDKPEIKFPNVKGYYETYFHRCHKIVVHNNQSVELLDSYAIRTNSESFDEACLNAEF